MKKRPMVGCKIVMGLAAGALIASLSPSARAEDDTTKSAAPVTAAELTAAKKHYSDGEKKYKAGDFEGAVADFRSANDVKPTPQAERYIGLCEDALGHYAVAVDWYEKFLVHVPDKMGPAADELKKREVEIKAMPGKVHVESSPSGADVAVDDNRPSGSTPMDIELAPGPHKITLSATGRLPTDKSLDVTFASAQTVIAELEPEPPPPAPPVVAVVTPPPPAPAPPPPPEARSPVPAYITGGIAIAAAGVGTVFGVIALNDKSDFDKNPTTQTADDGDTHSLIADMAFGIALTFGVTSAVLFLTKDEAAASPSTSSTGAPRTANRTAPKRARLPAILPMPIVGPHMSGAGFAVRF